MKIRFKQNDDRSGVPIIMVHGDEANRSLYKYLDDQIPYAYFSHMGNEEREFNFKSLNEIASIYVNQLLSSDITFPIILSGYSIGGLIAYEMACQLERLNKAIAGVILLDTKAPGCEGKKEYHNRQLKWNEHSVLRGFKLLRKKVAIARFSIFGMTMPKRIFFFHRMQQYRKLRQLYQPDVFSGPVFLIRSQVDNFSDHYLGWKEHLSEIGVLPVNGNHHEITTEPIIGDVAEHYNLLYPEILAAHFRRTEVT